MLLLAAGAITASAQTHAKPPAEAKPAAIAEKTPAHMPPVEGIRKTLFTVPLRYQDIRVGTGAEAMPKKLLKYYFTLWLASDGSEIDSTDNHRTPILDKDRKPVLDADGKPKMSDPQPAIMMMGTGHPLPGWDLGFEGMRAGGKRRIFIPWQLGLGERDIPARDGHPGIPAKSDLVLDVDLLDVMDAPNPPMHPSMMPEAHPAPGATPRLAAPAKPQSK